MKFYKRSSVRRDTCKFKKINHIQLKLLFGLSFYLSTLLINGQDLQWINIFTDDQGSSSDIQVDASGNVYSVGNFQGTIDFDPGAGVTNLTSNGSNDIFIQKTNNSGELIWVKSVGGVSDDGAYALYLASDGNIYLTGHFQGTVDFDPGAGTFNLTSAGTYDVFVLSLTSAGAFNWAYRGGGSSHDFGRDLVVDNSSNVYVTGQTYGGDFDNSANVETLGGAGNNDIFVIKINNKADYVWGYGFGSTANDMGATIGLDASGDVFVGGDFYGTIDFDPGVSTDNHTTNGSTDAFLLHLDQDGNYQETLTWGGVGSDKLQDFEFTSSGTLVAVGYFDGTVDMDPYSKTYELTALNSNSDIFVQHISLVEEGLIWARQIAVSSFSTVLDVELDVSDNIYIAGFYNSFGVTQFYDINGASLFNQIKTFKRTYGLAVQGSQFYLSGHLSGNVNVYFCNGSDFVVPGSGTKSFMSKYNIESAADKPAIGASSTDIYTSETVALNIASGSLNDATNWAWYSGSCGGTPVGTGTSLVVSPEVTTTYYAMGEGYTCLNPENCASITINVTPPSITYTGAGFTETSENLGEVEGSINLTIEGETFTSAGGELSAKNDYSVTNVPSGLFPTISVAADGLSAVLTFTGESSAHQDVDDVSDIQITFANSAFQGGDASIVSNASGASTNLGFDFNDNSPVLSYGFAYDISNETYKTPEFDFSNEDATPSGVAFSNDGMKMFMVGFANDSVYQYSLSKSFDITSGVTYDSIAIYVGGQDDNASGITFNNTGDKMYVTGTQNDEAYQYDLTTAFDLGDGVSYEGSFALGIAFPAGIAFSEDGYKMVTTGPLSDRVYEFNLTTAFDLTGTVDLVGNAQIIAGTGYSAQGICFNADGSSLFIIDDGSNNVNEYVLGAAYSPTSGFTFEQSMYMGHKDGSPRDLVFDADGKTLYFVGAIGVDLTQVDLNAGGFVESVTNDGSVTGSLTINLEDDVFTSPGGTFIGGVEYTISNLPSGLSPVMTVAADGASVELTFTGNATNHDIIHSVDRLNINFLDAAFSIGDNSIVSNNGSGSNNVFGVEFIEGPSIDDQEFSIEENSSNGTVVGTVVATDPYDQSLTYTITAGNDLNAFAISSSTGEVTVNDETGLDFETNSPFSLTIEASNGTVSSSATLTITLTDVAESPTDLSIDQSGIDENNLVDDVIGQFTTTDEDSGETYSYSLIETGSYPDNASFTIMDDQLLAGATFDFEAKSSFLIKVQTSDGNGGVFDKEIAIDINDVSETPTNIILSASSIQENNAVNAVVGTLSTEDPDAGETYTYSLVPNGSLPVPDNASFNINGNELRASASFNYEAKDSYLIMVRTDDGNGGIFNRSLTINITDGPEAPTNIYLSDSSIPENNAIGDVIGTFTSDDEDAGESYTYTLVTGDGDTDNGLFTIFGNQLRANSAFNFEVESSYSVRVQTDDNNGGTFGKSFTINVTNVPEAPTAIDLDNASISESVASGTVIGTLTTTDVDAGETYTYSFLDNTTYPDNASFDIVDDELVSAVVFDFETKNEYTVQIQTNDGNGGTTSEVFTISITDVPASITDIGLTSSSVDEGAASGTAVGTLSTLGEEVTGTYSYTLITGNGTNDADNGSFTIVDEELRTTAVFDFETKSSYNIYIQTDDGAGDTFEKAVVISVNDITEAPTDIDLDVTTIDENNSVDAVIGAFTATDEDAGETYTFTLEDDATYPDNTSFNIVSGELQAAESFDYESQSSFTINVQVSDGTYAFSKQFTITVIDDTDEALIWTGSAWVNGTPGAGTDDVIIDGDYNTADDGTLEVNSLVINSGKTLTVAPDNYLYVVGDITNDGSLVVESGADLMTHEAGDFTGNDAIIKRNTRYADGRYSFVGTPVQQTANVTDATLGSFVYTYDESQAFDPNDGLDRWITHSGQLVPGVGYTQANQQEIIFEGVPNVSTVNVNGTYTGTYDDGVNEENEGWVFVSNPYATAIEVGDFLAQTNIEGAVYIWDDNGSDNGRGTNADYIIANGTVAINTTPTPAGGASRYNGNLGSAQGFFVKLVDDSDTEITFTPGMRVIGNNADDNFFRTAGTPAYVRLNLTNEAGLFKQAIVGRIAGINDDQFDRSFDAKVFSSKAADLIYTLKDDKALAIQGISHEREVVQLAYNVAEAGMYTIALDLSNAQGEIFYLHDKQTERVVDLGTETYSFNTAAGQFTDRFELVPNARVLGLEANKIQVYAHEQTVYINLPEGTERTFELISLDGQRLLSRKLSRSTKIQTNLPAGVYIVTDGEQSHKIILK